MDVMDAKALVDLIVNNRELVRLLGKALADDVQFGRAMADALRRAERGGA